MNDELETIATFENAIDAEMARARLENEDILGFVLDAHMIGANWLLSNAIGGVKLAVRPEEAKRAKEILTTPVVATDNPDSGWGACPNCGNRKLEVRTSRRATNLTWLLLGIPLLFPRTSFLCTSCGTETSKLNL